MVMTVSPVVFTANTIGSSTIARIYNGKIPLYISTRDSQLVQLFGSGSNIILTNSINVSSAKLIMISSGYLSQKNNLSFLLNAKMKDGSIFMIGVYGALNYRQQFLSDWFNALKANHLQMTVIPVQVPSNESKMFLKPGQLLYSVPVIVLSIFPFGVHFISNPQDLSEELNYTVNAITIPPPLVLSSVDISTSPALGRSMAIKYDGFSPIGELGWSKKYYNVSEGTPGWVEGNTWYYEANVSVGSQVWYFFAAVSTTSAEGYSQWFGNWLPYNYHPSTNYQTNVWAGQQLYNWSPQNSGSNNPVVLKVGVSSDGSLYVQVSFSLSTTVDYSDTSNPANGLARALFTLYGAWWGTTYTIYQSSIGNLDPNLPGGYTPMLINQAYEADNAITSLQITINDVALYPTYVN